MPLPLKSRMCVQKEPVTDLTWKMAAGMQDYGFESTTGMGLGDISEHCGERQPWTTAKASWEGSKGLQKQNQGGEAYKVFVL